MADEAKSNVVQLPTQQGHRPRPTLDGYANFEAMVGVGTNNQSSGSGYQFNFITRNRTLVESMYRTSWIIGKVVDAVAEDMTKAGVTLEGNIAPADRGRFARAQDQMRIAKALCDVGKWGRLYGGSLGILLVEGQDMATPLDLKTVGRGMYKGIYAVDRWQVQPTVNELVADLGPDLGQPKYYEMLNSSLPFYQQRIHYSRVVRFDGVDLPLYQRQTENLWGQSVIERTYDRLVAFDSTTLGAAQLVYKAHLRILKVDDLRGILAMGGDAETALAASVAMIRRFQTNEGLTVIDKNDDFETQSYTFAGLDDVLIQFAQQLAGATGIPMVRMFGQSPKGMNATGEHDMEMYEGLISQEQGTRLLVPYTTINELTFRSVIGSAPPEGFGMTFNPLSELDDVQRGEVNDKDTRAALEVFDRSVISEQCLLEELRQSGQRTGRWTNITDEMIAAADPKPPEPVVEAPPGGPGAEEATTPPAAK